MWTNKLVKKLAEYVELPRKYKVEFHALSIPGLVINVDEKERTVEVLVTPDEGRIYDLDKHKPSDFKVIQLLEVEEWYDE